MPLLSYLFPSGLYSRRPRAPDLQSRVIDKDIQIWKTWDGLAAPLNPVQGDGVHKFDLVHSQLWPS